jgi:uncharacterized protein (DUF2147 family)
MIMKKIKIMILLTIVSLLSSAKLPAQTGKPDAIIGLYWSPKKDAKIEIYARGQQYFGRFVWASNPRKDINNPKKGLQNRDILGLELLTAFKYDDGVYDDGEIYDPETGKTYSCKMTLEGKTLKVRGYVGISLFGRTEYFERIK